MELFLWTRTAAGHKAAAHLHLEVTSQQDPSMFLESQQRFRSSMGGICPEGLQPSCSWALPTSPAHASSARPLPSTHPGKGRSSLQQVALPAPRLSGAPRRAGHGDCSSGWHQSHPRRGLCLAPSTHPALLPSQSQDKLAPVALGIACPKPPSSTQP